MKKNSKNQFFLYSFGFPQKLYLVYCFQIKVGSKKVGDTEYFKYVLNLPKNLVEESGFIGKDLVGKFEKGKIVLEIEKN